MSDLLYYLLLIACSIEDLRSDEIIIDLPLLMIPLVVIKNCVADSMYQVNPLGIVIAIIILYIMGVIGGGDAKVFAISAFYLRGQELIVILSVLASLIAEMLLSEYKRKTPLLVVFSISVLLMSLWLNALRILLTKPILAT